MRLLRGSGFLFLGSRISGYLVSIAFLLPAETVFLKKSRLRDVGHSLNCSSSGCSITSGSAFSRYLVVARSSVFHSFFRPKSRYAQNKSWRVVNLCWPSITRKRLTSRGELGLTPSIITAPR